MDALELFEERAAIAEFEGKLSRLDAEKLAYFELKKIGLLTEEIRERCRKTLSGLKEHQTVLKSSK